MEYLYDLKEMLCKELKDIAKKGELTAGSLDTIDKLTHSLKSTVTILAMETGGSSYDGMSGSRRRDSMGRYADGSYEGSYNRYNDSYRDNYSGMRRYSRDEGKSYLIKQFEDLMQEASNQEEQELLHQTLKKLKNM